MTTILVMGIAGCGNSVIGKLIAESLNLEHINGGDFQPEENKVKMAKGLLLDDRDQRKWFEILSNRIKNHKCVLSCSALKKSYRDILRSDGNELQIVYLDGNDKMHLERFEQRKGKSLSEQILKCQIETLEEPQDEGHTFKTKAGSDSDKIVSNFLIHKVIRFWFVESSPTDWFGNSVEFDQRVKDIFSHLHTKVSLGKYQEWRSDAQGCLAEIILLDQMSRNMFRDEARTYATDAQALASTLHMIESGFDRQLNRLMRSMAYMPLVHSENSEHQIKALELFKEIDIGVKEVIDHKKVIERFGRFPHRNKVLGRNSTQEELDFLNNEFSAFTKS